MAGINRHNSEYAAGPTYPAAVGDRYYAQDMFRDMNFNLNDSGQKVAAGFSFFPVLLKDSNMTKGTNWDDLNIPAAKGIVEYEVDVPLSYASLPPTVTQEDIYVRIETTAETDFDISGATLDGATTNYVKVTYNETDGSSRTRAKKAGTYVYEKVVSYTITVTPAAPTSKDLVLGTVVGDGATFLTIISYPRSRRYGDEYDYVIASQDEFNIIIDRTAVNQYRIKDNIKSIYVKYLSGGYQMTGATSPLQGGDAYGYIETNDCTRIVFEPGAFIDMHQNIGYIEVDTDYCYLDGVSVQGDKGVASAITRSYLLNANYVTFYNCESKIRLSNTTCYVFEGSGTAADQTSQYIGCKVSDFDSSGELGMMRYCQNIQNFNVTDIECTGGAVMMYGLRECKEANGIKLITLDHAGTVLYGLYDCDNISNIYMNDFNSSTNIIGISGCYQISNYKCIQFDGVDISVIYNSNNINNIYIEDIDGTGAIIGSQNSYYINNAYMYDLESSAGTCYGIAGGDQIFNCKCIQLDAIGNCYAYYQSNQLSNCYAEDIDSSGGNSFGYYECDQISCSYTIDIDSASGIYYGFYTCDNISASYATDCEAGFHTCNYIVGCTSEANDGNGFGMCSRVSTCLSHNNGNDGFINTNTIIGCTSLNNGGNGFDTCNHIEHNRANGNTGANYQNSFADWAGARAAAATDAGGENA